MRTRKRLKISVKDIFHRLRIKISRVNFLKSRCFLYTRILCLSPAAAWEISVKVTLNRVGVGCFHA